MKYFNLFVLIFVFSIVSNNYQARSENDLSNFNKLFFKTLDQNNLPNNNVISDEVKLIGVNNLSKPKALIKINGTNYTIKLGEDKNGYFLEKINGTLITIIKNDDKFSLRVGEIIYVAVNKKSSFSSNLQTEKKQIKTNIQLQADEFKRFTVNAKNNIKNIEFTDFERQVVSKIIEQPGRSAIGRLGWEMPSSILGQSLNQIGLQKDDIIITINNIPVGQMGYIYKQYKNPSITKFVLEIQRKEKVIALVWER